MYAALSAFGSGSENMTKYEEDAALTIELVKSACIMRVYIIDRLFQSRVEGDLSLLMKLRSLFSG